MARGIFKRGNIYWIRYSDGFKIIRESTKSTKFKDAEALLLARKKAISEGKEPEPIKRIPNYLFSHLAGEYLKWCERQRSFRSKKGFILQLVGVFGNIPLRQFTIRLIEQFQSDRLSKGNKPATVNRLIATLKHCLHKGYQWEMLSEETLKRVRGVKLLPENNRRLRYLSREECQALIDACKGVTKAIVITALNTGMRKGEILNLRWEQVDFRHGFILLDKTKNGERREIPVNQTLRETLQALPRRLDVPYVFFDPATGKPYQDIKRSFNTALRRAGIKDFHFHDLRHTFASHLTMSGVDITTVKELLGHKTLTMTLRYSHLAPSHKVKAVDILDNTLNGKSSAQKLHNLGAMA
jgi:integrase